MDDHDRRPGQFVEPQPYSSIFNAASYFIDRHLQEGRADRVAIECGNRRLTYRDLFEQVNRVGHALRTVLEVRPEERIVHRKSCTPSSRTSLAAC
ncbi:MAG TPA: hypothetical protein VH458_04610 [Vicinamibacterales bacterium]|jgi:benzoate-CoA ligase